MYLDLMVESDPQVRAPKRMHGQTEVQYDCPESTEGTALQGFGVEVADHPVRGAVFDPDVASFYVVVDEVVSDLEVSSLFATGLSAILFQQHCAFVILIYDVVLYFYSLCFQKEFYPEDHGHVVVDSNQLCFC